MKKNILAIIILALISFAAFASNDQKIWSVNDDVFKCIENLYIQQGLALPSGTGPWSTSELKIMMGKVSDDGSSLYVYVHDKLYDEKSFKADEFFDLKFDWNISIRGYGHSNTNFKLKYAADQQYYETSSYIYKTEYFNGGPFANAILETKAGNNFYGYFRYNFEMRSFLTGEAKIGSTDEGDGFDKKHFGFDFPTLSFEVMEHELSTKIPSRAFVAAGAGNWSVQLGTDNLSWGNGETGNLTLSNNFPSHNMLRLSFFGERCKYTFLMSFMPHPMMDNTRRYSTITPRTIGEQGIFYYMAHRLESRFFKDRLSVAVTESIVYQSEHGIDFRFTNPSTIFHNYFIKTNANSMITFDISWAFANGFSFYAQGALDDLNTAGESGEEGGTPNALAFLGGFKFSKPAGNGFVKASLEFVYEMPYMYLRSISGDNQIPGEYGLGYIGIYNTNYSRYPNERYYLGYKWGGDLIAGDLRVGYTQIKEYTFGLELFLMKHGKNAIDSLFATGPSAQGKAPSGTPIFTGYVKLSASWNIIPMVELFTHLYLVRCGNQDDVQCVFGVNIN